MHVGDDSGHVSLTICIVHYLSWPRDMLAWLMRVNGTNNSITEQDMHEPTEVQNQNCDSRLDKEHLSYKWIVTRTSKREHN